MTLIAVALYCEAKPLIKYFSLKKDPASTKFNIYSNPDTNITLIVSGTGILKCAVATTYLITRTRVGNDTSIFNIGICGSVSVDIETGTPVLFNKVVNSGTKRAYYPDILIRHGLTEGTLHSFSSPVTRNDINDDKYIFVDMEAAGFMEAATTFFSPHNIYCLKVVSDHLEQKRLEPEFVSGLLEKNITAIENVITASRSLNSSNNEILTSEELDLLDSIGERLMLSVTMKHQLKSMSRQYKIRTGYGLDCLVPFLNMQAESKREGKMIFEGIRKLLVDR